MDRFCVKCKENARAPSKKYCLLCHAAYMRQWRVGRDLGAQQRLKDNARSYAGVYKRRGKLLPKPCGKCGSTEVQMHHPDYGKPLEVEWLCRPCHMEVHRPDVHT